MPIAAPTQTTALARILQWFSKNLFATLSVSGVVAVLAFVGGAASSRATLMMGQCSPSMIETIKTGESALLDGRVADARAFAMDAIAIAPNCAFANQLAAKVAAKEMETLTKRQDEELRNQKRSACFVHASRAREYGGSDPHIDALLQHCIAVPSHIN